MQRELAKLQQYCDRATRAGARDITVADVIDGIACVMPKDKRTADKFCHFIGLIAYWAKSSGCDVILQAGGIPVLFDCLRSWPREKGVVTWVCLSLTSLAGWGSDTVQSAMRGVPDCEALLIAAHKSKLDDGNAADALEKLGYKKPEPASGCQCAIM